MEKLFPSATYEGSEIENVMLCYVMLAKKKLRGETFSEHIYFNSCIITFILFRVIGVDASNVVSKYSS
jgi:hypothetical protein